MILVKGKGMTGIEPAILAVSAVIAGTNLDHKKIRSKNLEAKSGAALLSAKQLSRLPLGSENAAYTTL
jgi:hypothetical protein